MEEQMIQELDILQIDEISGGSEESYQAGKEIGKFIVDMFQIIFN